jgi:hypothetical protein
MRPFCPSRLSLTLAALLLWLTAACGALDGSPSPTATPSAARIMGLEIAKTYGELLERARITVEPRPSAPEVKEQLRVLREEYKVLLGNYACLRDTLSETEQGGVASAFDSSWERLRPPDMAWLEDAAADYDLEDPGVRPLLEELYTLGDYAFLERVAESRPGEELLCG